MLVIKKLNKEVIDVFVGNGWEQWSRFNVAGRFPKLIAGQSLNDEQYKELLKVGKKAVA